MECRIAAADASDLHPSSSSSLHFCFFINFCVFSYFFFFSEDEMAMEMEEGLVLFLGNGGEGARRSKAFFLSFFLSVFLSFFPCCLLNA
jgi:hypothetical protein